MTSSQRVRRSCGLTCPTSPPDSGGRSSRQPPPREACTGLFAFPVGAGAARLGVLSVYREQAGPLRPEQLQDALMFADAVFVLALDHRHGLSTDLTR